jgi:AraC family transcriptional regulator, positive regulator of tynA and feaB
MTEMESSLLLDLDNVAWRARGEAWKGWVGQVSAGLDVAELREAVPSRGQIRRESLGAGQLLRLQSPGMRLRQPPQQANDARPPLVLMLMEQGRAHMHHAGRQTMLEAGHLYLLDAQLAMEFDSEASCLTTLHLPRALALRRHPTLTAAVGLRRDTRDDASARLLWSTLLHAQALLPQLDTQQRDRVLGAVLELLGLLCPLLPPALATDARVQQAWDDIERHLGDAALTPERLAALQGLSRRRLDALMVAHAGQPLAACLWSRRVHQAAAWLRAPQHAHKTLTDIAFELGFGSSAHFSRLFKARHGVAPRVWRQGGA